MHKSVNYTIDLYASTLRCIAFYLFYHHIATKYKRTIYLVYLFDISRHFFVSDSQYEKVTYIMICLICSILFLHCLHCSILVKNFDRNCHLNTNITILNYAYDSFCNACFSSICWNTINFLLNTNSKF